MIGADGRRAVPWFHWLALGAGFLLMYPLLIGAFGPIDALAIGFGPALDASRPAGLFDLAMRAGMRAALLGFLVWSTVYIVRKTAAGALWAGSLGMAVLCGAVVELRREDPSGVLGGATDVARERYGWLIRS